MNDMPKSETFVTFSLPGWDFAKAGSDAAQQVCNQGQIVAKTMQDWSAEYSKFLSQRMRRNSEAFAEIAKCQSAAAMIGIQAKWLQDAVGDYVNETSKLMELNSKIMRGFLPVFEQGFRFSTEAPKKA